MHIKSDLLRLCDFASVIEGLWELLCVTMRLAHMDREGTGWLFGRLLSRVAQLYACSEYACSEYAYSEHARLDRVWCRVSRLRPYFDM